MKKYFGTDGIRGVYKNGIDEKLAFSAGLAFGAYTGGGTVIVAQDTRLSGNALCSAATDGLVKAGCKVLCASVIPTPAVSLLLRCVGAAGGIMVSASHNPPCYNGLKFFGGTGIKLDGHGEDIVEGLIDNAPPFDSFGSKLDYSHAKEIYIKKLCARKGRLNGTKIFLDAGFGAAGTIAREVFELLGASVESFNDTPNGERINEDCGALFPSFIAKKISGDSLGFAFDGDADRMAMAYGGKVIDGDSILYSLSKGVECKTIVGTIMSNSALELRLKEDGKDFIRTDVGDKFVIDEMRRGGYALGGENSGHYVFYPEAMCGDGILSAVYAALGAENIESLELVPQRTTSFCAPSIMLSDPRLKKLIIETEREIKKLLVRPSGTEPKIRITAEDSDSAKVDRALKAFDEFFKNI